MPRRPRPSRPSALRIAAAALIYAAAHLLFSALPHTLPAGEGYLDLRPGVVVPLAAGLLAGPGAGALVGLFGRLAGDLLSGAGLDWAGLVYSALLGLIAGAGYRPRVNFRTLRPMGWALLWVLIATIAAGLLSALVMEVALLNPVAQAGGSTRAASEALSGVVAGLLLMPAILFGVSSVRK